MLNSIGRAVWGADRERMSGRLLTLLVTFLVALTKTERQIL
jgi:hypothetical protein